MSKRVYISADYAENDGDRMVVNTLHRWASDNLRIVDFVDMAKVVSGSVAQSADCRPCDLKEEFNKQINASSAVIFVIGDKTASRAAGSSCRRLTAGAGCSCTPYKQNVNGASTCKIWVIPSESFMTDVRKVNAYSYIQHEFEQAKKKGKTIIIVYNSLYKQPTWLPSYMSGYKDAAQPFWVYDKNLNKVGNYAFIKKALGYE